MTRKFPDRPWVGIGVIVHNNDDILLIKRGKEPNKGRWSLPGGAQNLGETVFEGAAREVLEECNIRTKNHRFVDVVDSIHQTSDQTIEFHYTLIEVGCDYDEGNILPLDDAEEVTWANIQDLAPYNLWEETLSVIRKSYRSRKA